MSARKGQVIEDQLHSTFLAEDVPVIVYLPENYSPLYSYPALYLQDGEDYFKLGKLAPLLDRLIDEGHIEKCMAVAVPVKDKKERLVRYRYSESKHEAYVRFFAEELIAYIDSNYATHPISGARTIIGDSLGGAVSLDIALQYPYTFHYVISQSGAFYDGSIERIGAFRYPPSLLSVYQSVGTKETDVDTSIGKQNLTEINRQVKQTFEQRGFPVRYREFEGDHTWGYWQEDLEYALKRIWSIS